MGNFPVIHLPEKRIRGYLCHRFYIRCNIRRRFSVKQRRLENLEKLIQLLSEQSGYAPNEPDLQVSALQSLLADFKTKNEAVRNTQMLLSNARISRNKAFYNTESGLVKVAADVKKYVKSVYGAIAPEFKQVSGLSFTHLRH